jgi:molybdate transport system substrate-binding protein
MRSVRLALLAGAAVLIGVLGLNLFADASHDEVTITVSAASDLIPAFEEIGERYRAETGYNVEFNFGSSGLLAQQVEAGAPVDIYVSADAGYVDDLVDKGMILSDSRLLYARGRIVVWSLNEEYGTVEALDELLRPEIRRVAIGNPDHAPYGRAGRDALRSAGVWDEIQPKLVLGENIRATLLYAESGDVEVAIVALSLALASEEGHWTLLPADMHTPIEQVLGIVAGTQHEEAAREFVRYVTDETGRATLAMYGFEFPDDD